MGTDLRPIKNDDVAYVLAHGKRDYGSGIVSYVRDADGAAARSVQAKLDDWLCVKDFGAVGDGVSDDTAAIQSCMNAADTQAKGVYVPCGTYLVGDLQMGSGADKTGTGAGESTSIRMLQGDGYNSCLKAKAGTGTVLRRRNTSGVAIKDIRVNCNYNADTGIDIQWNTSVGPSQQNRYSNVWVQKANILGIDAQNNNDSVFNAVHVRQTASGGKAADLRMSGGLMVITDCYWNEGIVWLNCQNAHIGGGVFGDGLYINGGGPNCLEFSGVQIYENPDTNRCIDMEASSNCDGLLFNSCLFITTNSGTVVNGRYRSGAIFNGCYWPNDAGTGEMFGSITPLGGTGKVPRFLFNHGRCLINFTPPAATVAVALREYLWDAATYYTDEILSGSTTWNPANLIAGATTTTTITVTGAALSDYALVSAPYTLSGLIATAYVSAADTVTVVLYNPTAGDVDLASGTWRARVIET